MQSIENQLLTAEGAVNTKRTQGNFHRSRRPNQFSPRLDS